MALERECDIVLDIIYSKFREEEYLTVNGVGTLDILTNKVLSLANIKSNFFLIMIILQEDGFIENVKRVENDMRYKVTEKGIAFLVNDSYVKRAERRKIEERIKRFQFNSRFVPYIISGLALIVSLFAYFKPATKQILLQPKVEWKMQCPNTPLYSQDSVLRTDTLPSPKSNFGQ